ncbi:outer membrane protein [Bartonella harrusi]|uniref:Porin n=1 Tax=Bartonella harrusi TaxID=2961895 RepID=A0ABY5EXM3_9HYPH|nr:porin [Bartonella harrusi]UTO29283.1 porin family protein [Bartonella harrusi]
MNTRIITTSVFALVSSSITHSIAQAADVVVPDKPAHVVSAIISPPQFSWAGFYFGGQVGSLSSKTSAMAPDIDTVFDPDEKNKNKEWVPVEKQYMPELSGFIGGLYAGVNFDIGHNFIFGIDTDILLTGVKDTITKEFPFMVEAGEHAGSKPGENGKSRGYYTNENEDESDSENDGNDYSKRNISFGSSGASEHNKFSRRVVRSEEKLKENQVVFHHSLKQKWTGATRARIGFSAGRIMPYLSGGIAYGQFRDFISVSITGEVPLNETSDVTKTMFGYTLGGGIDFAMTDNLIMRAEYRYSDFGKKKFDDKIEIKYKTNDFRAGIAYKF